MTRANVATKRALKAVDRAPEQDPKSTEKRVTFANTDCASNLGGLLGLAQSMPLLTYESARLGCVGDFTAAGKSDLLQRLSNATDSLARILGQIGLLMASYDTSMGTIDADNVVELGWTVNGIADLLLQLQGAREEIEDAVPVGGAHG